MANQGKRMVKENLIAQIGQGGGSEYTAGNGIDITEDVISVDTETIATVSALQSFTQSFGGALSNIYDGTTVVGKAKNDENGREIDEYYASKQEVADSTLPTYGIQPTVTNISDFANMDFADLVAAGLPILGSYDYKSTDPYQTIDLPKGEYCNVKGMFALRKQQSQSMPFYVIYVICDYTSNGAWTSYNQAQMYKSSHRTGLVFNTRLKATTYVTWTNAPDMYSNQIPVIFLTPAGVGNVQISAEYADRMYNNIKSMQLPLVITHPLSDVRYDTQIPCPTADGTYSLKVTVVDGAPTFEWVLDQA